MKAKILLLSLATLLLGACQSENEPTEAFNLLQKSESMEERNEFVTNTTAAMIQINAPRYNCEIVETALAGGDRVRICVKGAKDDLDDLLRFTGGGTMTIPRTPNGRAVYSFPDGNGIFIDAPETYYIVREPDGRLTTRPEREFNREFEPKGPGDKGCGNCANFTNEDVNGNGYCEAFKCEQSCGVMPCQEYKPKNQ